MAVQYQGLGYVTLTSAGTAQSISPGVQILTPGCCIQAATGNSGTIYVGGSNLDSTHRGIELPPGGVLDIEGPNIRGILEEFDLSEIKIDGSNTGDKVVVSYFIRRG